MEDGNVILQKIVRKNILELRSTKFKMDDLFSPKTGKTLYYYSLRRFT